MMTKVGSRQALHGVHCSDNDEQEQIIQLCCCLILPEVAVLALGSIQQAQNYFGPRICGHYCECE